MFPDFNKSKFAHSQFLIFNNFETVRCCYNVYSSQIVNFADVR